MTAKSNDMVLDDHLKSLELTNTCARRWIEMLGVEDAKTYLVFGADGMGDRINLVLESRGAPNFKARICASERGAISRRTLCYSRWRRHDPLWCVYYLDTEQFFSAAIQAREAAERQLKAGKTFTEVAKFLCEHFGGELHWPRGGEDE